MPSNIMSSEISLLPSVSPSKQDPFITIPLDIAYQINLCSATGLVLNNLPPIMQPARQLDVMWISRGMQ